MNQVESIICTKLERIIFIPKLLRNNLKQRHINYFFGCKKLFFKKIRNTIYTDLISIRFYLLVKIPSLYIKNPVRQFVVSSFSNAIPRPGHKSWKCRNRPTYNKIKFFFYLFNPKLLRSYVFKPQSCHDFTNLLKKNPFPEKESPRGFPENLRQYRHP